MRARALCAAAVPLAMLAGCDWFGTGQTGKATGTPTSGPGLIRAEAACKQDGLEAPKRQTIILVDAKAVQRSADATEFAQQNAGFRDLILSIADPAKAIASGLAAPRERITIAVVPSDGSAADPAFIGCVPGLSPDELAAANAKQSAAASVFSGGVAGDLEKSAENFRLQLIGGLVAAAKKADGVPAAQSGPIASSHFLQGVRASRTLWDDGDAVPRLVLVSDLSALDLDGSEGDQSTFDRGVAAGRSAGGDLGQAELHVVLPAQRPLPDQAFLRGYFLAQGATLASVATGRITDSPAPPRRLWRFAGEASYPSGAVPIDVRIGDDGRGKLTASWVTLLRDPRFPIPLTGQIACASAGSCRIVTDNGGFAQAWAGAASNAPKFSADLPFAGMRTASLQIAGDHLAGRVADDAVTVNKATDQTWIAVKADAKQL